MGVEGNEFVHRAISISISISASLIEDNYQLPSRSEAHQCIYKVIFKHTYGTTRHIMNLTAEYEWNIDSSLIVSKQRKA